MITRPESRKPMLSPSTVTVEISELRSTCLSTIRRSLKPRARAASMYSAVSVSMIPTRSVRKQDRGEVETDGDRGQGEAAQMADEALAVARRRQPAELEAEEEDQQQPEQERGHREGDHREQPDHVVGGAVSPQRRDHRQRNRDHDRDRHRVDQQVDGHRDLVGDQRADRRLLGDRVAEVERHRAGDEVGVLGDQRLIEPELRVQGRDRLRGGLRPERRSSPDRPGPGG